MTREAPLDRSAFKAWRVFATRWDDMDAYGHVNNTVHYQWFDSAVNSWLVDAGLLDVETGNPIGRSPNALFFWAAGFPDRSCRIASRMSARERPLSHRHLRAGLGASFCAR